MCDRGTRAYFYVGAGAPAAPLRSRKGQNSYKNVGFYQNNYITLTSDSSLREILSRGIVLPSSGVGRCGV